MGFPPLIGVAPRKPHGQQRDERRENKFRHRDRHAVAIEHTVERCCVEIRDDRLRRVRRAAAGLRDGLRSAAGQEPYRGMALDILGPAPAPVVKVNNRYRYRVTVIGRNDKTLRGLLSAFMKEFSRRPEHKALHIYTDCNLMD